MYFFYPAGVAPLKVQMPALSPTMAEGNIVKWLKKEGVVNTVFLFHVVLQQLVMFSMFYKSLCSLDFIN